MQVDGKRQGLSSFSVILIMLVFMVVGAAILPMLNIQYSPQQTMESLSAYCSFGDVSARVMESEVTSLVEGELSTLEGVTDVSATSYAGGGYVNVRFKKGTKMEAVRFEAATKLRQLRKSLPEGASVSLSGSVSGRETEDRNILIYTINANMPADRILDYVDKHIRTKLSRIEGVESVEESSAAPFEWQLTFDPNSLRAVGLTPYDLSNAFNQHFQNNIVGTQIKGDSLMLIRLRSTKLESQLENIPIRTVNGRMYYFGDFATAKYKEVPPSSYKRINGLNTIDIYVNGAEGINTIKVAKAVRDKMEELKMGFPENFSVRMTHDASVSLNTEIHKIFLRAVMSLLFLLLFVLLVSRSFRYLAIIGLTILVNLLSAAIFYWMFNIDIELYSLAGITVSLGIIIDTAIVMTDHYTYYGNRKVMISIAGALLTTIAALLVVFFLPADAREILTDFIWVIVINLTLSMIIAFTFVPALLDKIPLKSRGVANHSFKSKRIIVRWSQRYEKYILWSRSHRKVCIWLLIWFLGIPVFLLPSSVHHRNGEFSTTGGLVGLYNSTIGSRWYQKNKGIFEYALGGAFNIFVKNLDTGSFYMEPEEVLNKRLEVSANMAEGCTAQQMNEIIVGMEKWLSQFESIELFQTSVNGNSANISITFDKESSATREPYNIKQQLWTKAMGYGGATWYVSALDQDDNSLSNSVYHNSWDHTISLYGYNYDILYRYAEQMRDSLLSKKRVTAADIAGSWGGMPATEFYLKMDQRRIVQQGLNVRQYFSYLTDQLYDNAIGSIFDGEKNVRVELVSGQKDYYDLWHINNDLIDIDSTKIKLTDIGSITKRRTGVEISRTNQEYVVSVGYNFVGSYELANNMTEKLTKSFDKILPLGFHISNDDRLWGYREQSLEALLLFVIIPLIIFMICAILFESLKKPIAIIVMIPLGFIGLFLTFPLCKVSFDIGGLAAMIMLCGIVVNANIYLMSEYNTVTDCRYRRQKATLQLNVHYWVKAYNRKIIPTLLTIISTILGLVPFLFDGKANSFFWYSFAIGIIGGMIFSIFALVFVMPVFVPLTKRND